LKRSFRLAACASLLLAGCLDNPPYQRPALPLPQQWDAAQAAGAAPADDWWAGFGDAGLSRLQQQAVTGSPDLQAAVDRMLIARDQVTVARSHLYPSLSINGLPPDPINTAFAVNQGRQLDVDQNLYELSIDADYEIDFWGRVHQSIVSANAGYRASLFDAGTAYIALRCAVARTYFEVRELDEEGALAVQRRDLAAERLRLAQLRQAAGRSGAAPVLEAQQAQREAQGQLEGLQAARRDTANALAVLIGVTPESFELPAQPLRGSVSLPVPPEGLPSSLLERRPDIRAAEERLKAAHADIAVARAALFPQIGMTAKFGYVAEGLHDLKTQGTTVLGAGPTINFSVFDAGRLHANLDASRREQDLLLAEYRKSILAGLADVEKALSAYRLSSDDAARREQAQQDQQAQLQHLQQALDAGRQSRLELIAAQDRALELQGGAVRIYRQRLDSLLVLYQAMGGGWSASDLPLPADAPAEPKGSAP
jgi:NodT family efflux transporter outer membrane factor (OMF) lipoprotein